MPLPDPLPPLTPFDEGELLFVRACMLDDTPGVVGKLWHRQQTCRLLLTLDAEAASAKRYGAALALCHGVLEQLLSGGAVRGRLLADAQQALAGARAALEAKEG